VFCVISTAAKARPDFRRQDRPQTGVVWRLKKLSGVRLAEGAWRTAPNHSRPGSCVADADIDAEDHPERDPQNGH
jgi:hypothetical protein